MTGDKHPTAAVCNPTFRSLWKRARLQRWKLKVLQQAKEKVNVRSRGLFSRFLTTALLFIGSSLYTKGAPAEILTVLKNPLTLVKNSPSTDKGTPKQGLCCRELGTRIMPCPMLQQPDLLSREVAAVHKGTMFYKTPLKNRKTRSTANLIPGESIRTCVGHLRAFMELMWVRLTMGIALQDFV